MKTKLKLMFLAALATVALSSATAASTDSIRKESTVRAFRKANACPATGKIQATCPGYVIDHMIPLCAGGPDAVTNMAWQTTAASYTKDVLERSICKRLTACEKPKQ